MGSFKRVIETYDVAENKSLSANFQSVATEPKFVDNLSYQIKPANTDGTVDGEFFVSFSHDNVVWTRVELPEPATLRNPVGGAVWETLMIEINQIAAPFMRLEYESTVVGTGTFSATVSGRSI